MVYKKHVSKRTRKRKTKRTKSKFAHNIKLVHNFYKNYGGEETAVLNKIQLLESNNVTVKLFSKKNNTQ